LSFHALTTARARSTVRLTRDDLYKMVWARPLTAIAAEFGMSSVAFAKHCDWLDVPCPGRGHWAQVRAGKNPERTPLPRPTASTPLELDLETRERVAKPPKRLDIPQVEIGDVGAAHHPVVRQLEKLLAPGHRDHGLHTIWGDHHAVLKVGPDSRARALRLLDAIVNALHGRRHSVRLRHLPRPGYADDVRHLEAIIGKQPVEFWLTERLKQCEHVMTPEQKKSFDRTGYSLAPRYDFAPSGELTIELSVPYGTSVPHRWTDRPKKRLEQVIGEVVVAIEDAAVAWGQDAEERVKQAAVAETQRQSEEVRKHAAAYQLALETDLKAMAARWQNAEIHARPVSAESGRFGPT
jgi:hypothetical protein